MLSVSVTFITQSNWFEMWFDTAHKQGIVFTPSLHFVTQSAFCSCQTDDKPFDHLVNLIDAEKPHELDVTDEQRFCE